MINPILTRIIPKDFDIVECKCIMGSVRIAQYANNPGIIIIKRNP